MNNQQRAAILWQKLKDFFRNLNLFPSIPPSNDEYELRIQRISTRLFIFLFILSFIILLLYTSLIRVTKIINVKAPTLTEYTQLYSKHSQTLTCPCKTISINYEKFLNIQYTLHQVCTSIFVTNNWTSYVGAAGTGYFAYDFRSAGPFAFQSLSMFCKLVNKTISDSLSQFYSNQYVTASVTPLQLFEIQAEALINQFKSSTTNNFLLSLSTIRNTTQSNGLFSALRTNYQLTVKNGDYLVSSHSVIYSGCDCRLSATCAFESAMFNYPNMKPLFIVPGFYAGCYVIESLLKSNLQCYYNQNCINKIQTYLQSSVLIDVQALNSSLSSKYFENSTIENLLDNLMIEEWNWTQTYDKYYDECQPTQCTYNVETRNDIIYIVTTLFGLVGGLITILELVIPRVVKFIMYYIRKWKGRVVPDISIVET